MTWLPISRKFQRLFFSTFTTFLSKTILIKLEQTRHIGLLIIYKYYYCNQESHSLSSGLNVAVQVICDTDD